jgi:tetratricopeptide (TPR) repeat protein
MGQALRFALVVLALAMALGAMAQWISATELQHSRHLISSADEELPRDEAIARAVFFLTHAQRIWPVRSEPAYERARAGLVVRNSQASVHWLERCEGRVPNLLRWSQVAANAYQTRGRFEEAEAALTVALTLNPRAPLQEWASLARLRQMQGDFEGANEIMQRVGMGMGTAP